MNEIDLKLQEVKQRKKIGLMTHVVVGYPSLEETIELVRFMEECGVDMVELQIPFSDPLADGPTIMKACEDSLRNGTKVKDAFEIVKTLKSHVKIPLLFMCYYNTVFQYGIEKFCRDAAEVGVCGLIVPDMPIDEEEEEKLYYYANQFRLRTIQVVSPESTEKRLKKITKAANGFVYCTARQGITGVRKKLDKGLETYLQTVRKYIHLPLAVGFGISAKEQVETLVGKADIAVIGSKILNIINSHENYKKEVGDFIKQINVVELQV